MYIIFSTLFGFIQINQIATDIAIYKVIHTGGKTQSGGLNEDFAISEYHGSLYRLVTKLPHAEAPKARILNINREIIFLVKDIYFLQNLTTYEYCLTHKIQRKYYMYS